ncbi:hypothetical protein LPJ57_004586, partial [Coemansia sp. RSA 486]
MTQAVAMAVAMAAGVGFDRADTADVLQRGRARRNLRSRRLPRDARKHRPVHSRAVHSGVAGHAQQAAVADHGQNHIGHIAANGDAEASGKALLMLLLDLLLVLLLLQVGESLGHAFGTMPRESRLQVAWTTGCA